MSKRSAPPARERKVSGRQAHEAREKLAAGGLSHDERRRLRVAAGLRETAARRRHRQFKHRVIIVAGTVAAMAAVAAAVGLVSAIEAAGGQGVAGTFIVGSQPCFNRKVGCAWPGTFQSRDGGTVQHVAYDGTLPAGAGGGTRVPAIDPGGGSHVVYPPHGSSAWVSDLLLMVLVGGVVGVLLWISPLGLGRSETTGAVL